MIPLLLILVVTSTGLANRQSTNGFSAAVMIGGASPHGTSQERCHMASRGHTPVDITCAHVSGAACRFIASVAPSSVAPSSVTDTHGGLYLFGKYMDIDIVDVTIIVILVIALCYIILFNSDTAAEPLTGLKHIDNICGYALGVATIPIANAIYSRYDKWWRQPKRMEDTRKRIEADEYPYKYLVFVSTSSHIDDFERRHVMVALEQQLQIACRTDRQLVCSADDIEPGRRLFSETTSFLEQSGMMVIVISDGYIECVWCEEELQQARMLHKPLLIIQFGHVDQKTLNPILREVIRKNVSITMDEEYNITPGWESVCNVILKLLPCRLDSNKTSMPLHYLSIPFLLLLLYEWKQY